MSVQFGKRCKILRQERGLTQQQVADAVSISLREYQKIEKGEIAPGSEIFLRLVFFLGVDIERYRQDLLSQTSDTL